MKDKYSAVWVSHSSMNDYLKCPRAYFLKNVYRDPKTNHKIMLMQPALALGQVVHDVIDEVSFLPVNERLKIPLVSRFEQMWQKVSGVKGGFHTKEDEEEAKKRGRAMLERITDHPGPILKKAIKIPQDLPYFWLSEEDNIILCGKIDWLEYDEGTDSVRIIDFKTGKFDEDGDSLQLPIYHLLVDRCQKRKVFGAAYWYLNRDPVPREVALPDLVSSSQRVLEIAKRIALARKLNRFVCRQNDGCRVCQPLEAIVSGKATYVGENDYHQDIYVL